MPPENQTASGRAWSHRQQSRQRLRRNLCAGHQAKVQYLQLRHAAKRLTERCRRAQIQRQFWPPQAGGEYSFRRSNATALRELQPQRHTHDESFPLRPWGGTYGTTQQPETGGSQDFVRCFVSKGELDQRLPLRSPTTSASFRPVDPEAVRAPEVPRVRVELQYQPQFHPRPQQVCTSPQQYHR